MPAISGALASAYADLQARVTAMLAFNPAPIDFHAQLQIAVQMQANLQTAIDIGLPAPSIAAQIAIMKALVVALEQQLAIILNIQNALEVEGVFAYAYSGTTGEMGPSLPAAFPGGSSTEQTWALIFATVTPACWNAMQVAFKTSP